MKSSYKKIQRIAFFLGVFSLLTSCLNAEPEAPDFGPEVSAQSVASALSAPFEVLNPTSIQKGEFVHIESNQAISGGTKFVTKDTGITVIDRQEDSDSIDLTLAFQEVTYSSDGSSSSTSFEDTVSISKSSASSFSTSSFSSPSLQSSSALAASSVKALAISICEPTLDSAVTFHKLAVTSSSDPVPQQVQNTSFCSGQSSCNISVSNISFDQVIHGDGESQKISCEYSYSTEVPYLAGQMKRCITLAVPIDGRSVVITECDQILNFTSGSE